MLLALLLCACAAPPSDESPEDGSFLLYYLAPQDEATGGERLPSRYESLDLPETAALAETASAVVERLLLGPSDGTLESPLPDGVELLSLEIRDRMACVDLVGPLDRLSGVELAMADYCLTLSLTALDGVSSVSVTAGGKSLEQQPKEIFFERDVLLASMDDVLQTVTVKLYFQDENGQLAAEERTLELYEGQTLAESLLNALLEGPRSRDLSRVIPEDFQISFVRVENGVCTLHVSAESLGNLPEDPEQQSLILISLRESFRSIETVDGLRLISGGEEVPLPYAAS